MTKPYTPPMAPYLTILYEDEHLLVCDKQSGLLSVPGRLESHRDSLQLRAQEHTSTALTVHRLDMETSGIMVFAKGKAAHKTLSLQFQNREVEKEYEALLWGTMPRKEGSVDLPLICDWPNRPRQKVDHTVGKPSLTHYAVLSIEKDITRVRLMPVTGRSHQLRVHMQALGHAIIGDPFYAGKEARNASDRLCLHATKLVIFHPATHTQMTFTSAAPF